MPIFDIKTHDKTVNDFEPCEVTRIAHDLGEFTSYYTIAERDGVFYFLSEEVVRTKQRPDTLKPLQTFKLNDKNKAIGILKFNETMEKRDFIKNPPKPAIKDRIDCHNAFCKNGQHDAGGTCGICKGKGYIDVAPKRPTLRETVTEATYAFLNTLCDGLSQGIKQGKSEPYEVLREKCFSFLFEQYKGVSYSQKQEYVQGVARGFTNYKQFLLLSSTDDQSFKDFAKNITDFFVLEFQQFMLEQS